LKSSSHLAISLFSLVLSATVFAEANPCENAKTNIEMRECYSREKARVNERLDSAVAAIASNFRRDASEFADKGDTPVAASLSQAASKVEQSQESWKAYRDQYCDAILASYTTGTGGGTAHEECEFHLGQARLEDLQRFFLPAHSK
jgi:uncharacterized protein YecT (DUF1311 family)